MKRFQIRFSKGGKTYEPVIEAETDSKARDLARLQYGQDIQILGSKQV